MVSYKASAFTLLQLALPADGKGTSRPKLRNSGNSSTSLLSHIYNYFQEEPIFTPAISLEEFASVDSSKFQWVDPTEVQAGSSTCGYLNAPLGALPDVKYPTVKVYVCVRFAKNQPAPRGNLAVHCGGPGSLSSCVHDWDFDLGPDNIENYNIIGFDQRGMGRSLPSFVNTDCAMTTHDPDFAILNSIEFDQPETIRAGATVWKARSLACWNHPEFKLTIHKGQGVKKTYHFLEYSGTRQLAEDIERVRQLFGDQKLNLYGLSYGTKVMGVYATIFPSYVNLMVLDSNMDPGVDIERFAVDSTRARNHRFEYFISACDRNPNLCPISNMRHCITAMNELIKANSKELSDFIKNALAAATGQEPAAGDMQATELIAVFMKGLYGDFDKAPGLCEAAEAKDYVTFKEILGIPHPNMNLVRFDQNGSSVEIVENTNSTPTRATNDWPFTNYLTLAEVGKAALITLVAQDYSFGAYDEDSYVDFLFELNKKYSGAGTQSPVRQAYWWYSACYHAPTVTPLPPLGNSWLSGIIAGQIYDPQTSYLWTQEMRENFPSSSLLTSRSVNHGMLMAEETTTLNPACQKNVADYFATGVISFVDGTVCESDDVETSCTIEQVVMSSACV